MGTNYDDFNVNEWTYGWQTPPSLYIAVIQNIVKYFNYILKHKFYTKDNPGI